MATFRLQIPGWSLALVVLCIALGATCASAAEVQLAGIRLGQHALHLIQVYGQPGGIVKGGGATAPVASTGGGAPGGEAGGMPGGMPGMAGAPGGQSMAQMAEEGNTAGMMMGAMGGMLAGLMGGGGAQPRQEATAQAPAGGGSAPGPNGGSVGGAPPGPNPFFQSNCPDWAAPVWISMQPEETLWVYRKGAVVMGFVLDRDGYIIAIAVAGRKCDWARTAMWDPKRSIKLGDDMRTVINRYGYPDQSATPMGTNTWTPVERAFLGQNAGPTVSGISNASRDLIMHYGEGNNVEFLLDDMKVVRIHIWEPEARPPAARLTTAAPAAGAGAMGGAGGGMPGMMGPGGMAPGPMGP